MNQLYVYLYPLFFLDSFPISIITDHFVELPVLQSRFLPAIYLYIVVYMSVPPPSLSQAVTLF